MKIASALIQVYTGRGQDDEYVQPYRPHGGNHNGFSEGLSDFILSIGALVIAFIGLATILHKGPQVTKWMGNQVKSAISKIWKWGWKIVLGAVIFYVFFARR